jgi:hypothetical protein
LWWTGGDFGFRGAGGSWYGTIYLICIHARTRIMRVCACAHAGEDFRDCAAFVLGEIEMIEDGSVVVEPCSARIAGGEQFAVRTAALIAGGMSDYVHRQVAATFSVTATDADTRMQVAGIIAYGEGEERKMARALVGRLFDEPMGMMRDV